MGAEHKFSVTQLSCVRQSRLIFSKLSFALNPGEALLVEGANGSGKSSLLRLLAGLAAPEGGDITWEGHCIQALGSEYWQALHYLGHSNGIKSGLTVMENLRLSQQLAASAGPKPDIDSVLSELQLGAAKHTAAKFLSAGQKRRIALAKLALFHKTIWILDEPLTALDAATQEWFLTQLQRHLQHGGIAVISSHQPISSEHTAMQTLRLGQPC